MKKWLYFLAATLATSEMASVTSNAPTAPVTNLDPGTATDESVGALLNDATNGAVAWYTLVTREGDECTVHAVGIVNDITVEFPEARIDQGPSSHIMQIIGEYDAPSPAVDRNYGAAGMLAFLLTANLIR